MADIHVTFQSRNWNLSFDNYLLVCSELPVELRCWSLYPELNICTLQAEPLCLLNFLISNLNLGHIFLVIFLGLQTKVKPLICFVKNIGFIRIDNGLAILNRHGHNLIHILYIEIIVMFSGVHLSHHQRDPYI